MSILLPNVDEKSMELIIEHTLDLAEDEKRNGKNKLKTIIEWFKNGTWTLEKEEDYDYGLAYSQDKQKALKQASEKLNNDAIYARSKKWAIKMDKWMKEAGTDGQKSFLFAVGLSHIISAKNNLRQLLTTKGYTVEEIPKLDEGGTSSAHGNDVEEEEIEQQLEDKEEKQNEKSKLND
ncbi:hypothetical protein niasHS_005518 [Heterodera schachtii]|uniref:Uncharacterized protein n=2 Tax=Heterodera TaxID=34509 RepID=A0ABD2JMP2_HETSC